MFGGPLRLEDKVPGEKLSDSDSCFTETGWNSKSKEEELGCRLFIRILVQNPFLFFFKFEGLGGNVEVLLLTVWVWDLQKVLGTVPLQCPPVHFRDVRCSSSILIEGLKTLFPVSFFLSSSTPGPIERNPG